MSSECLPIHRVPNASRLFTDFLEHFERVGPFYRRPPLASSWWADEQKLIQYPAGRRQAVAAVLEKQNRAFGAAQPTLDNIERLRQGAPAVVTGQQVALFGGPLYCLLKAISVSLLAEKSGAVPVFWLATEDHDLEEVSSVALAAGDHLQNYRINVSHKEGAPVGSIRFGDEVTAAVKQLEANFGPSSALDILANSYRPGETFGSAFARFYSQASAELGIIFLDPSDPELHRLAQPVFRAAIEKCDRLRQRLDEREKELEAAGYHAQVKATPSHTLCFHVQDGVRMPVRRTQTGFVAGEKHLQAAELLSELERCPENFNGNVLLRPVVQDYLLPTLCYAGGPAEVAYFAQAAVVYEELAGRVTPIVPRISATLIEPRQKKLLHRYQMTVEDVFRGPENVSARVASQALPSGVLESFDAASTQLNDALTAIEKSLEHLDRTLVDAAENAGVKMRHQLQSLRDKAARAQLRKSEESQRHADELSTMLFPHKELQERQIGGVYFLLRYGQGVIAAMKDSLKVQCAGHQILALSPQEMGSGGVGASASTAPQ